MSPTPDETAEAEKAGRRHNAQDAQDMQAMHDIAARQGAECSPGNLPEGAVMTYKAAGDAGDYLVVEPAADGKEAQYHLQVKKNGTPDHTLMGAAWAALHGGYRGNQYAGPDKDKALAKLIALYHAEHMPLPGAEKAGDIPDAAETPVIFGTVKAVSDDELDILANPFGGPHNGKDADGEFFSPNTKFHEDQIPLPPVVYYHGYGDDKKPMGLPLFLGKSLRRWVDDQGVWYRVKVNQSIEQGRRVIDAAKRGTARASAGVVLASHRVNKSTGEILSWLNGEISIFETDTGKRPANSYAVALPAMKAVYQQAGLTLPELETNATPQTDATGANGPVAVARSTHPTKRTVEKPTMTEDEINAAAEAKLKADEEAEKNSNEAAIAERAKLLKSAKLQAAKEFEEKLATAEKARKDAEAEVEKMRKAQEVAGRRMGVDAPADETAAPHVMKFANLRKFENLNVDDMAFLAGLMDAAKHKDPAHDGLSKSLAQALATRMSEDRTVVKRRNGREIDMGAQARAALKAGGIDPADVLNANKANELDYSTQAGFGADWVGVEYSNRLWEVIRAGTFVLDSIPEVEVPDGAASIVIPVEGADPTFYKVAQTTDEDNTTKRPDATVTSSKVATTSDTLTVAKMGARTQFAGELTEDSLIPWVNNLRRQLEIAGAAQMEHVVIDGDTATGASTNINTIAGTPASTVVYLLLNGFRKLALVTNTANSRSASGGFVDTDFLATIKLMGVAGLNAQDKPKVEFILDPNTYWKALELASVKNRDVFMNATIENGALDSIWGYKVNQSYWMHADSAKRMANTSGKIDGTDSNNTTGSILAVRYDQWLFGYKRRMTIKLQEIIDADTTQIVALTRFGLVNRDNEASAVTYNVGIA